MGSLSHRIGRAIAAAALLGGAPAAAAQATPGSAIARELCAAVPRVPPLPSFELAFAALAEPVVGEGLNPAAGPVEPALPPIPEPPPAPPVAVGFLASRGLVVGHTQFDAAWQRVHDSLLTPACAAALLGLGADTPRAALLAAVNRWANRSIRYVEEAGDFWSDAAASLRTRRGDCEDIAVLKLQLLAALGVADEDLFLSIVRDRIRGRDHAVLVVRDGRRDWLLDSATDRLLDAAGANDYHAIVTFSGEHRWVHGF